MKITDLGANSLKNQGKKSWSKQSQENQRKVLEQTVSRITEKSQKNLKKFTENIKNQEKTRQEKTSQNKNSECRVKVVIRM